MERGLVAELHPWEPIEPITWTISYDAMEVHSNNLVHRLGLGIRLGVEHGAHTELHPSQM